MIQTEGTAKAKFQRTEHIVAFEKVQESHTGLNREISQGM